MPIEPVGTSPGHRALVLVRELLSLYNSRGSSLILAMLETDPATKALLARARSIVSETPEKKQLPEASPGCFYRWCPECHAQHQFAASAGPAVTS